MEAQRKIPRYELTWYLTSKLEIWDIFCFRTTETKLSNANGIILFLHTSININSAAKKISVLHSTLARRLSRSCISASNMRRITPRRAVHPRLKFKSGTEWRKNSTRTNKRVVVDFRRSGTSLIGYCRQINEISKEELLHSRC